VAIEERKLLAMDFFQKFRDEFEASGIPETITRGKVIRFHPLMKFITVSFIYQQKTYSINIDIQWRLDCNVTIKCLSPSYVVGGTKLTLSNEVKSPNKNVTRVYQN